MCNGGGSVYAAAWVEVSLPQQLVSPNIRTQLRSHTAWARGQYTPRSQGSLLLFCL